MDFQEMEDQVLPDVNVGNIINQLSQPNITEEQPKDAEPVESTEPVANSGDGMVKEPLATTSSSKKITASTKPRGIQEFIRILRPNLPRKSKSKAHKLLQQFAKGIIVEGTFQRTFPKKKPSKRGVRKPPAKNSKSKSKHISGSRRSAHSMFESSDSCSSDPCPRCGHSCCRISRY
ncbi:uncharacterized protein LOC142980187 [Anticarsia gemmatalis]|uniref:uncharacterized protein LOC142980187 n=1 Tax=Anticarsia gemmatalis TaxID=129554 RepID=UPI003F75A64F